MGERLRSTETAKRIGSVRDLEVYRKAFRVAMDIFEISKSFPKEETYSLTDQIRRSSRSVCSNLAEGCLRPGGAKEKISSRFFEQAF